MVSNEMKIQLLSMILMYLCLYIVLIMIGWCFGMILTKWVREQTRNPASLAQAGPSRLSESCRVSRRVLIRGSRLGDQGGV